MFEMKKPTILFDEAKHLYTDPADNCIIPSTTQISGLLEISGDYSGVPNIQFYADRGTLAHYALEMFQLTGSRETAIAMAQDKQAGMNATWDDAKGYFESGLEWLKIHPMKDIETERRFLGNVNGMRYAGTIDVVSRTLDGKMLGVIDWKTSKDCNKEGYFLQIGAYAEAVNADFGMVVRLREDGQEAEHILVDVKKYRELFVKLLEIFYDAEMTDEQKRAKAKELIFGTVQIAKDKAELLAVKNDEKKKIEKEIAELKDEITGTLNGVSGAYEDETVKVSLSYVPGGVTKKINTETLIVALAEHIGSDLLKKIVEENTEEKETAPSYRLTTKLITPKEPKAKKEPKEPKEPKVKKEKPEPVKKEEEPVAEKPATQTKFPSAGPLPIKEQITNCLKAKKITGDLEEMFWINLEGTFGCERSQPDFDMTTALEIAQESTKGFYEKLLEESKKGRI